MDYEAYKKEIFLLISDNKPKPEGELGIYFDNLCDPKSVYFDKPFVDLITYLVPTWFLNRPKWETPNKIGTLNSICVNLALHEFVKKMEQKRIYSGISLRQIKKSNWLHLNNVIVVQDLIAVLELFHWIRVVEYKPPTGRFSTCIEIHPLITSNVKDFYTP